MSAPARFDQNPGFWWHHEDFPLSIGTWSVALETP